MIGNRTVNYDALDLIVSIPNQSRVLLVNDLRENYDIFCSIVVYPVVPKGMILLRLIPTAVHTLEDVAYTIDTFKELKTKLEKGDYHSEEILNANA